MVGETLLKFVTVLKPDEVRDDILAIWRSERDRVVRELEAMLLGHMRDEVVVSLIKRLRER